MKRLGSFSVIIITIYVLLWSTACGFRWPSNYVMTNHVITYVFGFVPRGLVGEAGLLVFGHKWYAWKYLSAAILAVAFVFILWVIFEVVRSGYDFRDPVKLTVLAAFAASPFAKFYIHEAGYYEQYGYVFIIILLLFFMKDRVMDVYVIPGILGFISLLISETNIFLVIPVIFVMSFLRIVNPGADAAANAMKGTVKAGEVTEDAATEGEVAGDEGAGRKSDVGKTREKMVIWKRLLILIAAYIPHIVYCVVVWFYKMPEDTVKKLQDHDRDMVNNGFSSYNFTFREDVHLFLSGDRSNADKWERVFHKMHPWCAVYCVILILFVSYFIIRYRRDIKLLLTYILSAVLSGFAAYVIVLVAWDLDRYYFNTFMSIFFVSIFTIAKFIPDLKIKKTDMIPIGIMLAVCFALSINRFELFDEAVYNESWNDFIRVFGSKWG